IGPLGVMISERGLSLTYEGKPVNPKIFDKLQSEGKIPEDMTWDGAVKQAIEVSESLTGKLQAAQAEIAAEHKKLHENDPPPSPERQMTLAWLKGFLGSLVQNYEAFLPQAQPTGMAALMGGGAQAENPAERYKVSILADNSKTKGAPVVFVRTPSFKNLFGEAGGDKQIMMLPTGGMVQTESPGGPTLKSGAFLRANGGFLVLNLMDVLREQGVYESLIRMLRTGKAEITEGGAMSLMMDRGATYGVPAKVKVVLIGSPMLKHLIKNHDKDFPNLFRAAAEFEHSMRIAAESISGYLTFMKNVITRSTGKLMDMTREAMAAVLEQGARMADSNTDLSTSFGSLYSLLQEATYWAREAGRDQVAREDVDKALSERSEREGGMSRRMRELFTSNVFTIETKGEKVGQINALAVMGGEESGFGVPARVTATAFAGGPGGLVVSADQRAGSTGKSFDKALLILEGFLKSVFGKNKLVPAEVRISFEQNYGGIDGDSATQTQIYAALSALSGVPIKQGIAITGSADQFGNVQTIGGVNLKIEGYYAVAKAKGLDGTQGVIIPAANVRNLMLSPEIVEAVRTGKFHLWSVDHISQGVEILTGQPYSEVLKKADARVMGFLAGMKGGK
ncbi:AAA family ATPase, partial [Elusimicrobiota bacterium]